MGKITIKPLYFGQDESYLSQLFELFEQQWGEVDKAQNSVVAQKIPPPIAILDNQKVVGGVSFIEYPHPNGADSAIWINALLVLPQHRNHGLAKQLLEYAVTLASSYGEQRLYVYTDVPNFYRKQNWQAHHQNSDGKHWVLEYNFD
ncbi:GNAT family N-acetyltransferase [Vibrio sp. SCSIO 43136]|uniref:GNAT family N-acetyltransferase n=1 Tax=Vibrio sp. SCSIO 43136 TaxID=2819101 RepID=UPI00207502BC|nr:GNAT family N-acetyltransferase [Vibrio sp. SCSIO 43136]USD67637.1 GNAT family N-acetyltransferase [Vibrio sp. SCSIO 43136]